MKHRSWALAIVFPKSIHHWLMLGSAQLANLFPSVMFWGSRLFREVCLWFPFDMLSSACASQTPWRETLENMFCRLTCLTGIESVKKNGTTSHLSVPYYMLVCLKPRCHGVSTRCWEPARLSFGSKCCYVQTGETEKNVMRIQELWPPKI